MYKESTSQLLPWAIIAGAVLLVGGGIYYVFQPFVPQSADVRQETPEAIAKYKDWIRDNDMPFVGGKIKAADLPLALRKVIDHDVQNGDLKSARAFIRLAIDKKLDSQVLALTPTPATTELMTQMQQARQKVETLWQIVEIVKRPGAVSETDVTPLAERFEQQPFQPKTCPEEATEIAALRGPLLAQRERSAAVRRVVEAIDQKCVAEPAAK